jgi:Zn-dependent protease with chaperone function/competence protein ComGC
MNTSSPAPNLTLGTLTLPKEKSYFIFIAIFSVLVWIGLAITIVGLIYALMFGLFAWIGNGLLIAYLRSEAVRVDESQLPELHATFAKVCQKFGLTEQPRLYVLQSGGALNAFATRFSGRNFVVVYSEMLEAFGPASSEMQFILGHEIGHIRSNHILKRLLCAPGMFLPLLGSAYSRACEASCDRHGAFATDELGGALRAMLALSGGKGQRDALSAAAFARQNTDERGFFVSLHELTSGYPTLSGRTRMLMGLYDPAHAAQPGRNPFAYFFALFTPGGSLAGGGGANMLVMVVIIGLLAAMAIPAFQKVRQSAQLKACANNARIITLTVEQYIAENNKAPAKYEDFVGPGKLLMAMPSCPVPGGEYEVRIGDKNEPIVECSVHGDLLHGPLPSAASASR